MAGPDEAAKWFYDRNGGCTKRHGKLICNLDSLANIYKIQSNLDTHIGARYGGHSTGWHRLGERVLGAVTTMLEEWRSSACVVFLVLIYASTVRYHAFCANLSISHRDHSLSESRGLNLTAQGRVLPRKPCYAHIRAGLLDHLGQLEICWMSLFGLL